MSAPSVPVAPINVKIGDERLIKMTENASRKFTELYHVQHLTSNRLDDLCRVTICAIQRLYAMLRGEELNEDIDEKSGFELATADQRQRDVQYSPALPIETFDFVI